MEWKPLLSDLVDHIKIAYFPYLGYLVAIPNQYTIPEYVLDEIGLKQQVIPLTSSSACYLI